MITPDDIRMMYQRTGRNLRSIEAVARYFNESRSVLAAQPNILYSLCRSALTENIDSVSDFLLQAEAHYRQKRAYHESLIVSRLSSRQSLADDLAEVDCVEEALADLRRITGENFIARFRE